MENKLLDIVVVLFFLVSVSCIEKEDKGIMPKLNIIYVVSNKHTTQGFDIHGSRFAGLNPTPNLDALAKEGMIFDSAFVNNSICVPSHVAIFTGQRAETNGVLDFEGSSAPNSQRNR